MTYGVICNSAKACYPPFQKASSPCASRKILNYESEGEYSDQRDITVHNMGAGQTLIRFLPVIYPPVVKAIEARN